MDLSRLFDKNTPEEGEVWVNPRTGTECRVVEVKQGRVKYAIGDVWFSCTLASFRKTYRKKR